MTLSAMQIAWEPGPFGTDDLELGAAEGYKSTASPLRRRDEVRCCIRGCRTWLPRRSRGDPPKFCPDHGISVSTSPTYVYQDWTRNFLLRHDLIGAVKEDKIESWRLGNESSEDALSWNMFVGLAHLGGLREAFEALTGCKARERLSSSAFLRWRWSSCNLLFHRCSSGPPNTPRSYLVLEELSCALDEVSY